MAMEATSAFRSAATARTVESAPGTEASTASALRQPDMRMSQAVDAAEIATTPMTSRIEAARITAHGGDGGRRHRRAHGGARDQHGGIGKRPRHGHGPAGQAPQGRGDGRARQPRGRDAEPVEDEPAESGDQDLGEMGEARDASRASAQWTPLPLTSNADDAHKPCGHGLPMPSVSIAEISKPC